MKKKFISLLFLIVTASTVFAQTTNNNQSTYTDYVNNLTKETTGMPSLSSNTKILDIPLVGGITQFASTFDYFTRIIGMLCVLGAFLAILFNSFKLWSGTIEIKKSFVDLAYKAVLVITLCVIYRPATNYCLKLANSIGAYCNGGYQKIDHVYTEAYSSLKAQIDKGLVAIQKTIKEYALEASDGKKFISDKTCEDLISYGMTKEEVEDWAKQNGLSIAHEEFKTGWGGKDEQFARTESAGWYDADGNLITQNKKFFFFSYTDVANLTKNDKKMNRNISDKEQKQMVAKLSGLLEVLDIVDISEVAEEEQALQKQSAEQNIKNVFYSPWLKTKENANTFFISPNAILKTCLVMSDALAYGVGNTINEVGEIEEVRLIPTWKSIFRFIMTMIYKMGMVIACVIIMAEYTLVILEFYIVRALAMFLIPMFFLDATKSFAQNLIRLFLTYFMKIMVSVMLCFFALGMFMDTLSLTYNSLDLEATTTLVTYISTMVLGLILAMKAPAIATTIISGQPSMGMGDIARVAGGMAHAAHSMERMAHRGEEFFKKAAKGGQDFARGTANTFQALDSAIVAGRTTGAKIDDAKLSGQWSGNDFDKGMAQTGAFFRTLGSAAGQAIGDKAHKAVFGTDRHHLDSEGKNTEGFWKVGQQVFVGGQQRIATAEDVRKHNAQIAENKAQTAADKSIQNHPYKPETSISDEERRRKEMMPEQGM